MKYTPRNQLLLSLAFLVANHWFPAFCAGADIPSYASRSVTALAQQQFVCHLGYSLAECHAQSTVVKAAVGRYHGEALGHWAWILVRSEDWKPLMQKLKLNPASPAFTVLERRETFLEEALLKPNPDRALQLMWDFGLPLNQVLDLAVTHELGHALCRDLNEFHADQFGRLLREGRSPNCAAQTK